MAPLRALPPYLHNISGCHASPEFSEIFSTANELTCLMQVRNAALCKWPTKGRSTAIQNNTLTTPSQEPNSACFKPTHTLAFLLIQALVPFFLVWYLFKWLFPQAFDPDPFSWKLPAQITWVHKLGPLGVNNHAQPPSSSPNTHTHQHVPQYHSFYSSAED